MDTYYQAKEVPSRKKIPYAVMLLEGHAIIWWRSLVQKEMQAATWRAFKTAIIAQFKRIDDNNLARNELRKLSQITSVQQYIADFTALTYRITDMHDAEAFHTF